MSRRFSRSKRSNSLALRSWMVAYTSWAVFLASSVAPRSCLSSCTMRVTFVSPPSFLSCRPSSFASLSFFFSISVMSVCRVSSAWARSSTACWMPGSRARFSCSKPSDFTLCTEALRVRRLMRTEPEPRALSSPADCHWLCTSWNLLNLIRERPVSASTETMSSLLLISASAARDASLSCFSVSASLALFARKASSVSSRGGFSM
mmetsp:Transcript_4129/g.14784  ORF Transcript_4129/g.14784 Transcript_4129/m.14784 type:complete len:205 (-) Transcript_4129:1168-1782(-)